MTVNLLTRATVLIVDDQPINIQTLYEMLSAEHEVLMATSGQAAIDLCVKSQPDLILLDVMMPTIDGHEVCRRLQQIPSTSNIPVIFVTAQNNPDEEAAGFDMGAVDFISRPLNATVVRARVRTQLTLKRQSDQLRSLAFIDGLTGIPNRRHFDETFGVEWRDCRRNGYSLALIMIDIDHFKKYNDHYGHAQGDVCLRSVSAAIKSSLGRAHDLAARYGGEEFACILPNCDVQGAKEVAEKMNKAVDALGIAHAMSTTSNHITISAGASCVVPTDGLPFTQLIVAADRQLYLAKEAGRNRVCVAPY